MEWTAMDSGACSVARTVDALGDRWSVLVLRDVFNGVRRFDDLHRHLGIARDVLTKRLGTLVEQGVLTRVPYREPGRRTRYEYRLTAAGRDLRPVLLALMAWGDRHRAEPAGAPYLPVHPGCGASVAVHLICADGHDIPVTELLRLDPGPGAREGEARQPA